MQLNQRRRPPLVSDGVGLFLVGGAAGTFTAVWLGTPLFLLVAGFVVGLSAAFIDWAVVRRIARGWRLFLSRLLIVAGLAFGLPWVTQPSAGRAFEEAFGVPPPSGVRELSAHTRSVGPGDLVALIRFAADQATIDALAAGKGFALQDAGLDRMRDLGWDWPTYWRMTVSPLADERTGGDAWRVPPAIRDPRVYRWTRPGTATGRDESTTILWDPDTGQAYVVRNM
jgi:hypothetical protein